MCRGDRHALKRISDEWDCQPAVKGQAEQISRPAANLSDHPLWRNKCMPHIHVLFVLNRKANLELK
jgi:hypothetical protein